MNNHAPPAALPPAPEGPLSKQELTAHIYSAIVERAGPERAGLYAGGLGALIDAANFFSACGPGAEKEERLALYAINAMQLGLAREAGFMLQCLANLAVYETLGRGHAHIVSATDMAAADTAATFLASIIDDAPPGEGGQGA